MRSMSLLEPKLPMAVIINGLDVDPTLSLRASGVNTASVPQPP